MDKAAEGLRVLLHDPVAARMCRAVQVQDSSPAVFNNKEAVDYSKVERGNGEEVEGGDDLPVIVQEREPSFRFALVTAALQPLRVARNCRVGNFETRAGAIHHECAARPISDCRPSYPRSGLEFPC